MTNPNFIYIAPQKTGSTWLFRNFMEHPEIFVPDIKYTNYFNIFPDRSRQWYLSHFAAAAPQHRAVGEFGLGYLREPAALDGLYEIDPEMKFIYFFRDVVDQKIAEMFHLRRIKNETPEALMELFRRRMEAGDRASEQLERWLATFGRGQFFFARFEDIKTRPEALLRDVYAFLGVEPRPPVALTATGENRRQAPRQVWLGLVARRVADALRALGFYRLLSSLKHSERVRRLMFRELSDRETAELITGLRDRYAPVFAEEQVRLLRLMTVESPTVVPATRHPAPEPTDALLDGGGASAA